MYGEINKNTPLSSYQPSDEIKELTRIVKKDYAEGDRILRTPYLELNDRSVIEDENRGQMMFNAFVDTSTEDPATAWEWRGTRSKARNKGIAMHAQLTSNYLLPVFQAQNDNDEVDQGFSEVMRYIIEWMAEPNNSNYQSSFLQIVFAMETNPVTYLGAEFCEIYQTIKEKLDDGSYSKKEILDEVLSGFQAPIWSASQVLITNAYERNIQKQRAIITRRWCDYSELEAKYKNHPNWVYVRPGIKSVYSDDTDLFYDIKDEDHPTLIAEETWMCRREDMQVCFVNGIYMGNINSVDNNPIVHRDNRNAPKYNLVPFGFHRIGEHFFFYKSMMNAMGWDNMLYDAMTEIVMNQAMLQVNMPIAISGADNPDSEVIFPKAVVAMENENARITPLLPPSNLGAGFNALRETADSIDEASLSDTMTGQLPPASQKAYSVNVAQENAKKIIAGVGKSLAESIIQYGDLMKDIAINHITTPQVEELLGGNLRLNYKSFFLPAKGGLNANDKKIIFDQTLIGTEMTPEQKKYESVKLLEQTGYPKSTMAIFRINPELWANFKYLTKCDVQEMFTKSLEAMQNFLLSLRRELLNDPNIDMFGLDKLVMRAALQSQGEDLVKEPQAPMTPPSPLTPTPSVSQPAANMIQ